MESILTSIKNLLGIVASDTSFDTSIILHINSVFTTLNQLGVGPVGGFAISDDTASWDDFLSDRTDLEAVKSYIYLKVKLLFDPPTIATVMESTKQLINELEWRLNVAAEE